LGSETAKYNREEAMKEIHSSFLKDYGSSTTPKKYGLESLANNDDYKSRLDKARSNFLSGESSHLKPTSSSYSNNSSVEDKFSRQEAFGYENVKLISLPYLMYAHVGKVTAEKHAKPLKNAEG
jgi:hypothetical protein